MLDKLASFAFHQTYFRPVKEDPARPSKQKRVTNGRAAHDGNDNANSWPNRFFDRI